MKGVGAKKTPTKNRETAKNEMGKESRAAAGWKDTNRTTGEVGRGRNRKAQPIDWLR